MPHAVMWHVFAVLQPIGGQPADGSRHSTASFGPTAVPEPSPLHREMEKALN